MLSNRNVSLKIISGLIAILNAGDDKTECLGNQRNTKAATVCHLMA